MASQKSALPSLKASLQLGDIDLEVEKSRKTGNAQTKWRFIIVAGKIVGIYGKTWEDTMANGGLVRWDNDRTKRQKIHGQFQR